MKKNLIGIIALVGLITVSAVSARAQISTKVTTEVPFSFIAGGYELSAGEYTISFNEITSSGDVLLIESADGKSRVIVLARSQTIARTDEKSGLSFIRFGGDYYLNGVTVFARKLDVEPVVSRSRLVALRETEN